MSVDKIRVFQALDNAKENGHDFSTTSVGQVVADLGQYCAYCERVDDLNSLRAIVREWQSIQNSKPEALVQMQVEACKSLRMLSGESMLDAYLRGTGQTESEGKVRSAKAAEARLRDLANKPKERG